MHDNVADHQIVKQPRADEDSDTEQDSSGDDDAEYETSSEDSDDSHQQYVNLHISHVWHLILMNQPWFSG